MARIPTPIALACLATVPLAACGGGHNAVELTTFHDSSSYAIGASMGKSLTDVKDSVNLDYLVAGLRDAAQGSTRLTQAQMDAVLMRFTQEARVTTTKKREAEGKENLAKGEAYRKTNAARPGVKTTASGLQYEVLTEGTGPHPTAASTVTVNYRGTLIDGTEFDSSYKRGEPVTFPLNRVIPGWTEGLQLMRAGAKYRFVIPPELAYGDKGAGTDIPPNATLVFEVELLKIAS